MEIYDTYFEKLSENLKETYNRRGFGFDYFKNKEAACSFVLSKIDKDNIITFGGSMSVAQVGLFDAIKDGDYPNFFNRNDKTLTKVAELKAFVADVYLCSANAITRDGMVICIDGNGNRVAAITYGPKRVYMIVGKNKLTVNADEALMRVRNVAAAQNSIRFGLDNPCAVDMLCNEECEIEKRLCSYRLHLEKSAPEGRIHIIFVDEDLGF